ncbi:uncharacterized protein LOC141851450 isoform X2 [Brevipalpus obovatus]|uniref:uncharacterized protein LOC141851450 isoform X2 n=1 Tax=Brevipalpus obovatus TaxID=246614 RepID=UPI003D9E0D7A
MIMNSDEREGSSCRSLVCDGNGIIIAEMVYRCMICAFISDSIGDAQRHYQVRHMEGDSQPSTSVKHEPIDFLDEEDDSDAGPLSTSYTSNARGGFVTCAVCHITKFYASVQRRYGQFTCMGCAKFFGRFLLKPRKYCCPNLGKCPLDATPRCKACLLLACIETYSIDEKRMKIVNMHRPVRKSATLNRTQAGSSANIADEEGSPQSANNDGGMTGECGGSGTSIPMSNNSVQLVNSNSDSSPSGSLNNLNSNQGSPTHLLIKHPQQAVSAAAAAAAAVHRTSILSQQLTSGNNGNNGRSRSSSNTAVLALLRSSGKKNWGCRKCAGCLVEDCGKCNYCLDKPKFGGANTLKKKCILRKCLLQEQQKIEQAQNSLRNALK